MKGNDRVVRLMCADVPCEDYIMLIHVAMNTVVISLSKLIISLVTACWQSK